MSTTYPQDTQRTPDSGGGRSKVENLSSRELLESASISIKSVFKMLVFLSSIIIGQAVFIYQSDKEEIKNHGRLLQEMVSKADLRFAEQRLHDEIQNIKQDLQEEIRNAKANVSKPDSGKKRVEAKGVNRYS